MQQSSYTFIFDSYVSTERHDLYVQILSQKETIEAKNQTIEDLNTQVGRLKKIMDENQHIYSIPDLTMYGGPKPQVMSQINALRQEIQSALRQRADKEGECEGLQSTIKLLQSRAPKIDDIRKLVVQQTNIILTQARNDISSQEKEIKDLKQRIYDLEQQLRLGQPQGQDFSEEIKRLGETIQLKNKQIEAEKKRTKEQYDKTQQYIALYNEALEKLRNIQPSEAQATDSQCQRCPILENETKQQLILINKLNNEIDALKEEIENLKLSQNQSQSSEQIEGLKREIKKLEIIKEGLTEKVTKLEASLQKLKNSLEEALKQVQDQKKRIGELEMELMEEKTKSGLTIQALQQQIADLQRQVEQLTQIKKDLEDNEERLRKQLQALQDKQLYQLQGHIKDPSNGVSREIYLNLQDELKRQQKVNAELEAVILKRLNEDQKLRDIEGKLSTLNDKIKETKTGHDESLQKPLADLLNEKKELQKQKDEEISDLKKQIDDLHRQMSSSVTPQEQKPQKPIEPPKPKCLPRKNEFGDGKVTFRRMEVQFRYIL